MPGSHMNASFALVDFNIAIPKSDVSLPDNPGAWVEALNKSIQDYGTIFINIRSSDGTEVLMTFSPEPEQVDEAFALKISLATLDQLRRVMDFIQADAIRVIKASQTAPQ